MSAPSHVSAKLSKLIPLLGSDKPGEVVATAAAIQRTLRSVGLDWHDLSASLTLLDSPVQGPPYTSQPDAEPADWQSAYAACLRQPHRFTERELDFLRQLEARAKRAHAGDPSVRQNAWLNALYQRVNSKGT